MVDWVVGPLFARRWGEFDLARGCVGLGVEAAIEALTGRVVRHVLELVVVVVALIAPLFAALIEELERVVPVCKEGKAGPRAAGGGQG